MSQLPWSKTTTVIGAFAAAVAAVAAAISLYLVLASSWPLTLVALLVAAALLLVVYRAAWSKESELHDPTQRLHLKPTEDGPLLVRTDEVDTLYHLCKSEAVVVFQGDSGSGKTALVRAGPGLAQRLKTEAPATRLPLIIDQYGKDWQTGPATALIVQLRRALSLPGTGPGVPPTPGELTAAISALIAQLAVPPLLIFDQFEDYILLHSGRFMPKKRAWITSAELCSANAFWAQITELIRAETISCLFVTQSEYASVVSATIIAPGQDYRTLSLPPFEIHDLKTVVEDLTLPLIRDPARGWKNLQKQLCKELAQAGALPADLAFSLRALHTLGRPTLRRYIAAGHLKGMESRQLDFMIKVAADSSQLTKTQILSILEAMIDDADRAGLRPRLAPHSVARTTDDLTRAVFGDRPPTAAESTGLQHALWSLRDADVVKEQLDPATGAKSWKLYSDFLCGVVGALAPNPNPWQSKLNSYALEYETAASFWEKTEKLLPLPLQATLIWQRLRSSFHYGPARGFALFSLLKLAPILLLAVAAVGRIQLVQRKGDAKLFRAWGLPLDLTQRQSQLTALRLSGPLNRIDWLRDNLLKLNLSGANIDDHAGPYPAHLLALDLSYNDQVTSLEDLPGSLQELTIVGLSQLKDLRGSPRHLRVLRAISSGVTDFTGLPASVEELEIGGPGLSSLEQLPAHLPKLVRLTLDHTGISNLRGLPPAVKFLTLRMTPGGSDFHLDAEQQRLAGLTALTLEQVPGVTLSRLPSSLLTLEIGADAVNNSFHLPNLAGLPPNLEQLTIKGYVFDDPHHALKPQHWEGLLAASKLKSLAVIDLPDLPAAPLRFPPTLHSLTLKGDGDIDLQAVHDLASLRTLRLGSTRVGDLHLIPPSVRRLELEAIDIRDLGQVPGFIVHLMIHWPPHLVSASGLPANLQSLELLRCTELKSLRSVPPSLISMNVAGTRLDSLPSGLDHLLVLNMSGTSLQRLQGVPRELTVLTVSLGLDNLGQLPPTVTDLRFEAHALPRGFE